MGDYDEDDRIAEVGDPGKLRESLKVCLDEVRVCLRRLAASDPLGTSGVDSEARRLVEDSVYANTFGVKWMENVIEKTQEAAQHSTHEVNLLTEQVAGSTARIDSLESKVMHRLDNIERATTAATRIATSTTTTTPQTQNSAAKTTHSLGPTINPTRKTQAPSKTVTNPLEAHHPARLIVQILPEGIKPEDRPDPVRLNEAINARLASTPESRHMKVVSHKWSTNGNCVVLTRADQTAAELIKFKDLFIDAIAGFNLCFA
ncbi:hypothetical protein B0H10DRAFT_2227956 [Mycena sp. CBHHK59/15]|nr:hypothetical protein B0H10DRAFT_2227956 [Mycena sp. CBHHK59/15]